jgi:polysaccharide pyruvyl transferase WcaK-like protein
MAAVLGVDSRVLGFSWNAEPCRGAATALRAAGEAGATLLLRDPVSLRRAGTDGLPSTVPTADLVFLATASSAVAVQRYLGAEHGPFGIINVSGFIGRSVDQVAEYDGVIDSLLRRGLRVVLLPHAARSGANDISACRQVYQRHSGRGLIFVAELLRPADVMGLCAAASIVVTGRMHLAIIALNNAVPTVVLSTQGKVEGLLQLFDIADNSIDPAPSFGLELSVAVERTLEQSPVQIKNSLPQVRELARRNLSGLPPP